MARRRSGIGKRELLETGIIDTSLELLSSKLDLFLIRVIMASPFCSNEVSVLETPAGMNGRRAAQAAVHHMSRRLSHKRQ